MLLTIVGRQVLNLNKICRCSDSLSKMWSRGPLFSEQSRQRSVNAVKLRSSGSVIAKHLMRRSRRHELSMYTAVALGWRETVRPAYRGCRQGGDEASRRGCVRGALRSARHPPPRPGPGPPPPAAPPASRARTQPGWPEKRHFSYLASAIADRLRIAMTDLLD